METLLVFLLFTSVSLSLAQESPDPVRDSDGNLVRSGTEYYIFPLIRGIGGTLTLAPTRNESCPLDVVQALWFDNGLPLKFKPVDPKEDVIRESTDLNIIFSAASSICNQSNVWMLEEYEGQRIVTAHGVSGNPSQQTISNWFKIEKYYHSYKIVFCPTVCDLCKPVCGDIGVEIDEKGNSRLAISDWPFRITFKKAEGIKTFL